MRATAWSLAALSGGASALVRLSAPSRHGVVSSKSDRVVLCSAEGGPDASSSSSPGSSPPAFEFEDEDELDSTMSRALPWASRPVGLDSLVSEAGDYAFALEAGDFGFDPFGWTEVGWGLNAGETSAERFDRVYAYREAELKHCRLAMLAAVGWPISELYDGSLSQRFGLQTELVNPDSQGIGMAPSLLNGGLGQVSIAYWLVVLAGAAIVESVGKERVYEAARVNTVRIPGDFGFDPLKLFPTDAEAMDFNDATKAFDLAASLEASSKMLSSLSGADLDEADDEAPPSTARPTLSASVRKKQTAMIQQELTHGRVAMLAIVGFVVQEFTTKIPVVEETPQFFLPDANEVQAEQEFLDVGKASFEILLDTTKAIIETAQNQ